VPKRLILGEQQCFCLGRRFSKHKMTRYAKNLVAEWLPGHGYVTSVAKNAKRASTRKYLRGLGSCV